MLEININKVLNYCDDLKYYKTAVSATNNDVIGCIYRVCDLVDNYQLKKELTDMITYGFKPRCNDILKKLDNVTDIIDNSVTATEISIEEFTERTWTVLKKMENLCVSLNSEGSNI